MQQPGKRRRPSPWDIAATELIGTIVATAERIAAARSSSGDLVYPTDTESRLMRAVARSSYCLAIADVARVLRILQVFLTPPGRAALERARSAEAVWLQGLLGDLADRPMAKVAHVLNVIRRRLERDERAWRELERAQRERRRLSRDRFFG